jgi:hypothetical protein
VNTFGENIQPLAHQSCSWAEGTASFWEKPSKEIHREQEKRNEKKAWLLHAVSHSAVLDNNAFGKQPKVFLVTLNLQKQSKTN